MQPTPPKNSGAADAWSLDQSGSTASNRREKLNSECGAETVSRGFSGIGQVAADRSSLSWFKVLE
jgi:hypothetical protein